MIQGSTAMDTVAVGGAGALPVGYGQGTSRPDLVQMDVADNPHDPSFATHIEIQQQEQQQQQQQQGGGGGRLKLCGPASAIVLSLLVLVAFIGASFNRVTQRVQYLCVAALIVPCVAAIKLTCSGKLSLRTDDPNTVPAHAVVVRFVLGFVGLLPLIVLLSLFITGLLRWALAALLSNLDDSGYRVASVCIFIVALVVAEESSKLLMYVMIDKRSGVSRPELFVYYGMATTLGLASAEVYLTTRELAFIMTGDDAAPVPIGAVLGVVAMSTWFIVPMHLLSSYYLGLAAARVQVLGAQARSVFPVPLLVAILYRSMFLASIFAVALPLNLGLGFGLAVACYALFVVFVMSYQRGMPSEYLRATGYLHFMGYGVLPSSDEAAGGGGDGGAPAPATSAIVDDESVDVLSPPRVVVSAASVPR